MGWVNGEKRDGWNGGKERDASRWCDGRWSEVRKKIGVLELVQYIRRKDDRHKAAHSNVGEEHKKSKSEKKSPLLPRYILQMYHKI